MKAVYKFITLFVLCLEISFINTAPVYFIAAPSVLRVNVPETVSISVAQVNYAVDITLYIQDYPAKSKRLYERTVTVSPNEVQNTTFILRPSDFNQTSDSKNEYVSLVAKSTTRALRFQKEAVILLSRQSGYIFVQTDKSVYTPNQEVKVRVIPLNELRRPSVSPIHIDIKNPQGVIVQRKNATYNGTFITDRFKLPSKPLYGNNWTIEAKFTDGVETKTVVTFEVKEYVLPKFSIQIRTEPDIILPTTTSITVNISTQYFHGEKVSGSCTLSYGILADGTKKISDVDLKNQLSSGSTEFRIDTSKLQNKFPDYWFPDGARLYLQVSVLDDGTGRREEITHKSTVFSHQPYKISTARSQKYFKPGLIYYLKIETFLANGKTASFCPIKLSCTKLTIPGLEIIITLPRNDYITDKKGWLTIPIELQYMITQLKCQIQTDSDRNSYDQTVQANVIFSATKMQSAHVQNRYIQVKPVLNNGRLSAEVTSNLERSHDLIHLVMSGGRILSTVHTNEDITFLQTITSDASPNLRVLTYAVDRWHGQTIVLADSSVLEVENSCGSHELEIVVPDTEVTPKSVLTFNVTGPPSGRVGFLAVDKALYQLSDKNRMQREKMFSEFAAHDIGCTVGGGISVDKVFEDAGLTVISNAGVVTGQRNTVNCPTNGRRKRSIAATDETNPCCQAGRNFSFTFGLNHLLGESDCYTEGQRVFNLTSSSNCAKTFYRCCKDYVARRGDQVTGPQGLEGLFSTNRQPESMFEFDRTVVMSQQDEEYTFRDINVQMDEIPVRSYFPESWMFEEGSLDSTGSLSKSVVVPDSTTTHIIQAVSLSPTFGMCVADPVDVVSTKDFFVDLDLPYSVVRMEQTEIRVTLYNYRSRKLPCYVRLLEVDGICSTEQDTLSIEVEAGDVELARFPIVPMKAGDFELDVMVLCVGVGDRVKKTLKVVNEGREEKRTISFWLDPRGRRRHHHEETDTTIEISHPFTSINTQVTTLDLSLPKEAIPGTGQCRVSAIANIMDAAVQTVLGGVHDLLDNVPHGCGEQTMILMAPIVYAMRYLQGTHKLTPQAEMRGKFFMKVGYQRELSFRKSDGSFSVWQHRDSSTWLTAFVMKVFCQAKRYIDIDQNVICSGMQWLFSKQNQNGSFSEPSPVYHKEIMGGINGEISLTAFVVISMLECDCRLPGTNDNIRRAVDFLENQFLRSHHPYSLSITAYALVLANSHKKWRINRKLLRYSIQTSTGLKYWPIEPADSANQTNVPYWYRKNPSAVSIETTAYALLTQLALDKVRFSKNIVEWMIEQQQASGAFVSTQDTIVGLQALSMYNIKKYAEDVNMLCIVTNGDNSTFRKSLNLRENEAMVEKSIHDIPVTGKLHITTQGQGVARMEVEVRFNVNDTRQDECKFDLNIYTDDIQVDIQREKQENVEMLCDVCGECTEPDYDILFERYNVPDPNPRIGYSNANTYPPSRVHRPSTETRDHNTEILNIDLSGEVDIGPQGSSRQRNTRRNDRRRNPRRQSRRNERRRRFEREKRSVRRRGASRRQKCLEICVSYLGNSILDMPVIDVGIPTGYIVEDEDLQKMVKAAVFIDSYDVSNRGVTFYLEKIPQEEICFKMRLIMDFEVENLQSAKIEVFDYSKKDERCVKFYSLQYEVAELDVFCSKDDCHCVEGECAESYDNKIKGALIEANTIYDMTCNGYDYVLRVEATGLRLSGNHIIVSTVIHSIVYRVNERSDLTVNGEIEFWMNLRCSVDMLQTGHYYIIYGNGGYPYVDEDGNKKFRYYLHRDSVVMKDYTRAMYNPDNNAHLGYWRRFFNMMESHISRNGRC